MGSIETGSIGDGKWIDVRFSGRGGEYFRIWIVNIFLSIITLGIYSAWAKVRTRRYFYGNTSIQGSSFEYLAKPLAILKGRLIAVLFLALVLGAGYLHPLADLVSIVIIALFAPWAIWRSLVFNARMTSYRNVRFGFAGKVGPLYRHVFLLPILPLLIVAVVLGVQYALGVIQFDVADPAAKSRTATILGLSIGLGITGTYLLIPYIQKSLTGYYLDGHRYGQGRFSASLATAFYYLVYLKLIVIGFLLLAAVVALIVVAQAAMPDFGVIPDRSGTVGESGISSAQLWLTTPLLLLFVAASVWMKAYTQSRFRNYAYSKLGLDDVAVFRSGMTVNGLFGVQLTNLILMVLSLGLAWPWARVRLTRYRLETLALRIDGSLDEYLTQARRRQSALGEEVGEAFDLDLDLGM